MKPTKLACLSRLSLQLRSECKHFPIASNEGEGETRKQKLHCALFHVVSCIHVQAFCESWHICFHDQPSPFCAAVNLKANAKNLFRIKIAIILRNSLLTVFFLHYITAPFEILPRFWIINDLYNNDRSNFFVNIVGLFDDFKSYPNDSEDQIEILVVPRQHVYRYSKRISL